MYKGLIVYIITDRLSITREKHFSGGNFSPPHKISEHGRDFNSFGLRKIEHQWFAWQHIHQ